MANNLLVNCFSEEALLVWRQCGFRFDSVGVLLYVYSIPINDSLWFFYPQDSLVVYVCMCGVEPLSILGLSQADPLMQGFWC